MKKNIEKIAEWFLIVFGVACLSLFIGIILSFLQKQPLWIRLTSIAGFVIVLAAATIVYNRQIEDACKEIEKNEEKTNE